MRRAYHLKPPAHQRKHVVPIVEEVVEEDVDNDSPLADSGKRKETEASQGDNNPPGDVSLPPPPKKKTTSSQPRRMAVISSNDK